MKFDIPQVVRKVISHKRSLLLVMAILGLLIFSAVALILLQSDGNSAVAKYDLLQVEKEINKHSYEFGKLEKEINFLKKINEERKHRLTRITLKLLRMKIKLFYMEQHRQPDKKEIHYVLNPLPMELYSGKREIHFERNYKGGWYYDHRLGNLSINSDERVYNIILNDF